MLKLSKHIFIFGIVLYLINISHAEASRAPSSTEACRSLLYSLLNKKNTFKATVANFDDNIHPTQFQYGELVVKNKVKKLLQMSKKQLQKYLKKKTIPFVFGPDGRYWIIDRHHTSKALIRVRDILSESGINPNKITIKFEMTEDWSHLSMDNFLKKMEEAEYIYPSIDGKYIDPNQLPNDLDGLTNDPYRSLAWLIRTASAFEKVLKPFLEFIWGDFLRTKMDIVNRDLTEVDLIEAFYHVINNPHLIKDLPGYTRLQLKDEKELKELVGKMLKAAIPFI